MDEKLLEMVEKARLRICELNLEIAKIKESLGQGIVVESPKTIAKLYWADNLEEILDEKDLMKLFRISKKEILRIARSYPYEKLLPCSECGRVVSIIALSKAELAGLRKTSLMQQRKGNRVICPTCMKKKTEKHQARIEEKERSKAIVIQQAKRIEELRKMSYKKYLQTPEWKEIRLKKLKSAYFRCELCNKSGSALRVHHRTYERRGNEWLKDLIVLCKKCHEKFHDIVVE